MTNREQLMLWVIVVLVGCVGLMGWAAKYPSAKACSEVMFVEGL